ncbi:response regulator [Candidatus Saccharibacteria bacterium]|nr:response regulator [Candidatus Saccharibacteria bacterium]
MAIKTILCIEDDRLIGEMYVRSLEQAGYTVDWMINGSDAIVAARNKSYDLILLDVMLPEHKGNEILNILRGRGRDEIPNSKVLVLTNFEQDEESRRSMELKADGYLIKADITPRKLIDIIKRLEKQ